MRGISIMLIMLHNLLHLYPGVLHESEFSYDGNLIDKFFVLLTGGTITGYDLLSFFGWYGVPVFIFLSGYGLVCRYEGDDVAAERFDRWGFIRHNWFKLVRLMLLGVTVFTVSAVIITIYRGDHYWPRIASTLIPLTGLNDVLYFKLHSNPGVYWYFGLAMELYVIYALLVHGRSRKWMWLLTGVCFVLVSVWSIFPVMSSCGLSETYLGYNFVRWMLPFACGVWFGRRKSVRIAWEFFLVLAVSVILFLPAHLSVWSWQIAGVMAVIIIMAVSVMFERVPYFGNIWSRIGVLSAYLFVAHPVVRHFTRFLTYDSGENAESTFWVCAGYVFLVFLAAVVYKWLTEQIFPLKRI